jgi:hypothetical protein
MNLSTKVADWIAERDATIASQAAEIERMRFALIQMTPDYEDMISDAADRGTYEETWLKECRQIAAFARAALQPKEGR